MDMLDGETEVRDYNLERLIMLSDGVFAIAMTLLALELRPPEPWDGSVPALLESMAGPFFAFFWSFLSISIMWASHRRSFGRFKRADFGLTVYNLILLALVTMIPAATRILTAGHYVPTLIWLYVGLFQLIGVVNCLMWCHAAFLTDILKPGMNLRVRVVVALILLLVSPAMTATGVLAALPGLHWTPLLIPALALATAYFRRWAEQGEAPAPTPVRKPPARRRR